LLFPRKHPELSEASPLSEFQRNPVKKKRAKPAMNPMQLNKNVPRRTVRVLRKVIAIYLLLLGLGLMLRAAFSFSL